MSSVVVQLKNAVRWLLGGVYAVVLMVWGLVRMPFHLLAGFVEDQFESEGESEGEAGTLEALGKTVFAVVYLFFLGLYRILAFPFEVVATYWALGERRTGSGDGPPAGGSGDRDGDDGAGDGEE